MADEDMPEATISVERLSSTVGDADVIFLDTNLRDEVNPFLEAVQSTVLYEELPAVKAGKVFGFGKATVAGYTDANYTLDQVEKALQELRDS